MNKRDHKYKEINNIVPIILSICCYGGAIYMIVILCCQYYANLDSSQASMKRFNNLPSGRYPFFTFCIHAKEGKLFNNEILLQRFGLSKEEYYQTLIGMRNATNLQLNNIKFDKMLLEQMILWKYLKRKIIHILHTTSGIPRLKIPWAPPYAKAFVIQPRIALLMIPFTTPICHSTQSK